MGYELPISCGFQMELSTTGQLPHTSVPSGSKACGRVSSLKLWNLRVDAQREGSSSDHLLILARHLLVQANPSLLDVLVWHPERRPGSLTGEEHKTGPVSPAPDRRPSLYPGTSPGQAPAPQ